MQGIGRGKLRRQEQGARLGEAVAPRRRVRLRQQRLRPLPESNSVDCKARGDHSVSCKGHAGRKLRRIKGQQLLCALVRGDLFEQDVPKDYDVAAAGPRGAHIFRIDTLGCLLKAEEQPDVPTGQPSAQIAVKVVGTGQTGGGVRSTQDGTRGMKATYILTACLVSEAVGVDEVVAFRREARGRPGPGSLETPRRGMAAHVVVQLLGVVRGGVQGLEQFKELLRCGGRKGFNRVPDQHDAILRPNPEGKATGVCAWVTLMDVRVRSGAGKPGQHFAVRIEKGRGS